MQDMISIIVPVYNVNKYLDKCVSSLLYQKYKNIEVILVDDGSTDGSELLCEKWKKKDNRIIVLHQKNSGVSAARNIGLKHSNGQYIGFVDADDYVSDDIYVKMIDAIKTFKVDGAFCGYKKVYTDKIVKFKNDFHSKVIDAKNAIYECNNGWNLTIWNKIFLREKLIVDGKMIKFSNELYIGEDAYWLVHVLNNCKKVACCNHIGYYYNVGREGSAVTQSYNEKRLQSCINRYKANLACYEFLEKKGNFYSYMLYRRCVFSLKDIVIYLYKTENKRIFEDYVSLFKKVLNKYRRIKFRDSMFVLKCYCIILAMHIKLPKIAIKVIELL